MARGCYIERNDPLRCRWTKNKSHIEKEYQDGTERQQDGKEFADRIRR